MAWLVIVAAEMLTGAPGVGGFLWQEYNSLVYSHILLSDPGHRPDRLRSRPADGRGRAPVQNRLRNAHGVSRNSRREQEISTAEANPNRRTCCPCCATSTCRSKNGVRLHRRPLRRRQDDVDLADRRPHRTGSRRDPARRQGDSRSGPGARHDISKLFFAALADGLRKHLSGGGCGGAASGGKRQTAAHGALHQAGESRQRRWTSCRASFPAACASEWRWRAAWRWTRRCC